MTSACLRLGPLLLVVAGCGDIDLGDVTHFSDGFESGDLTGWHQMAGDTNGASYTFPGGSFAVVADQHRGGAHALLLELAGQPGRQEHAAVQRWGQHPKDAYYSFFAYWPRRYQIDDHWCFLQFRAPPASSASSNDDIMWTLCIRNDATGAMLLEVGLQEPAIPRRALALAAALPEQRWVHFELRVHLALDATGLVQLWMDGQLVFERVDVRTALTDLTRIFITSTGEDISPAPVQLYIDDVTISPVRWYPAVGRQEGRAP